MTSSTLPTAEQLDRVALLCAAPEQRRYFFDRLNNPQWVKPLDERGFFGAPDLEPADAGPSRSESSSVSTVFSPQTRPESAPSSSSEASPKGRIRLSSAQQKSSERRFPSLEKTI